jgi:hypothetical protein
MRNLKAALILCSVALEACSTTPSTLNTFPYNRTEYPGHIAILKADYSDEVGHACDATFGVSRKVQGFRETSFVVNSELCGDPEKKAWKTLHVLYTCGYGPLLDAQAIEGETITLSCLPWYDFSRDRR